MLEELKKFRDRIALEREIYSDSKEFFDLLTDILIEVGCIIEREEKVEVDSDVEDGVLSSV